MKLLVRAANWIGDAILSLPALRAISQAYPDAQIDVLARPWVADLYGREQSIHQIVTLEGKPGLHDLRLKWGQARKLAREGYDLAVLFPNSFESALLPGLAKIPRIVGYNRDGRRLLLTDPIPRPKSGEIPDHERFYYLELLRRAGIIRDLPPANSILFDRLDVARIHGRELFSQRGIPLPVIGVSPGAAYGTAKRWLPERFAQSAEILAGESGASVAVFGSAAEREVCEHVADRAGGVSLAGKTTLRDYLDLTAACSLVLTNDSGAMHVAYASGVPSVTIFGPTRENATGPVGDLARIVRHPVECSPCMLRECPIDHRCMTRIPAEQVAHVARGLLSNFPS